MTEPVTSAQRGTDRADAAGEVRAGQPTGRRHDVLAMLRAAAGPLSIAEIAERLDVHPNTVRFHLDTLTEAEQVERLRAGPRGPGRPPLVFRARRGMDPAGPRNYRLLAGILVNNLADDPDPVTRATDAGREWGRQLAEPSDRSSEPDDEQSIGRLVGLLDELGFAPEQRSSAGGRQLGLRHCPFLDLVETRARLVCPVHLGLMQGAMTTMGTSLTVADLEPFAEPDLCLAHLGEAGNEHS